MKANNAEQILVKQDELEARREMLADAMSDLTDREKRIFMARRLEDNPVTLEELSGEFDISRERVRQIEVRAFEKVQKAMKAAARELAKPTAQLEHAAGLRQVKTNRYEATGPDENPALFQSFFRTCYFTFNRIFQPRGGTDLIRPLSIMNSAKRS